MSSEEFENNKIDFNSSMTDLMTSLMIIFILLLVILFNHIGERGRKVRDVMVEDLSTQISSVHNLKITEDEKDPLSIIINIDEKNDLKFESNKSEISENSKPILRRFTNEMLDYVCKEDIKANIDSIQIIGHTDANPVKNDPKFGNLELSQDRALSVLKFALYQVGTDTPKGICLQELVSINGRGMAELKATPAESRRVEFKIRLKSYEQTKKSKIDEIKQFANRI